MSTNRSTRILCFASLEIALRLSLYGVMLYLLHGQLSGGMWLLLTCLCAMSVLHSLCALVLSIRPMQMTERVVWMLEKGEHDPESVLRMSRGRWDRNDDLKKLLSYIERILRSSYDSEILKSQAEIHALQSQINPHFLYNTLETIRSQAVIKGVSSIEEMTEALADIFRYSISRPGEMATLRAEIENIDRYLVIQRYRFPNKFRFLKMVEEDRLLDCRIPVLTLQPLVENALHHGLEMKMGSGTVGLRVVGTQDRIIVIVSDDGLGMTRQRLDEISRALDLEEESAIHTERKGRSHSGIALLNVHRRIRFYFGKQYGLRLYSAEQVGTNAVLTLPRVLPAAGEEEPCRKY